MIFTPTSLGGAFLVEPEERADERGFFARTYCEREFAARDLCTTWVQGNVSFNLKKHTLRGLHWQASPHEEIKLIRCTAGALHDVIVDLRPGSPTCRKWVAVELSARNRRALYVPRGFAHGFLTLADATEAIYQVSDFYHPESARGVRWDDPALGIDWPAQPAVMSQKDRDCPWVTP